MGQSGDLEPAEDALSAAAKKGRRGLPRRKKSADYAWNVVCGTPSWVCRVLIRSEYSFILTASFWTLAILYAFQAFLSAPHV